MARSGSNYSSKSGARPYNLARMATENSAAALMNKPKLIRQAAILADGDSTGSGKSVTFQVFLWGIPDYPFRMLLLLLNNKKKSLTVSKIYQSVAKVASNIN